LVSTAEERRQRRATRTRRGIIDAGADLFERRGLMRTTVEQIAEEADVSPATVYSVAGGKAGVLGALVDDFHTAAMAVDVENLLARCSTPAEVIRALGATSADADPTYHRTLHIIFSAAPHDELAGAALARATDWHRPVVRRFAERLVELRPDADLDAAAVADTLWFFFGWGAWETLRRDYDWPLEQRRDWLIALADRALDV
jgi:AcrR family transcriptional regulator